VEYFQTQSAKDWPEELIPQVNDSVPDSRSITGLAIVLDRVDHFSYEDDLQGNDVLERVVLRLKLG
jgi:hypothetical protein